MKLDINNYYIKLSQNILEEAIDRACKGHTKKPEVRRMLKYKKLNAKILYEALCNDTWTKFLKYRELTKVNAGNGKVRHIHTPSLTTRVYQHLLLLFIEPLYKKKDNYNALNCKINCGITATEKSKSVVKKMKHVFYDLRDYNYYLVIDQRKCYEHITIKSFRRALKRLITDKWLIDFATKVCFVDKELPIGTPTSPLIHHILMLEFDYFVKTLSPISIRYADDNFIAFHTKKEASEAKWRIMNFWWYKLGIRAKRHNLIIAPFEKPLDFCGYLFHRNPDKSVCDHNKGYTKIRSIIAERAKKCKTQESWAAYHGLLSHADSNYLKIKIIMANKLTDLTKSIKISRDKDHPQIPIDSLIKHNISFVIKDYEIRYDKNKEPNFIKLVIFMRENINPDGDLIKNDNPFKPEKQNTVYIRLVQGNFKFISNYLLELENKFGGKDNLLPITNVSFVNKCGYIFKDSTNEITKTILTDEQFEDLFSSDTK